MTTGSQFLGHGELWWVTSHPQGIELAQVIDVRPDAVEDLALSHIVQGQPHGVGVIGLHLPILWEVTDHGVPCHPACDPFGNFVTMPSIKMCVQQLHFLPGPIAECLVSWQLLLRR